MLSAVRRHWLLAALSSIAAFLGCVLALALVPSTYTATSVVAMVPRPGSGADLLLLSIPNYAALATSEAVATDLAERFDAPAELIQAAIRVEHPPASNTLLLSVEWDDPSVAADLVNRLTRLIVTATATDAVLSADVVADASPPSVPTWPPWSAGLVLGGLLSLAVGLGVARLAERRRRRVASPGVLARLVEHEGPPAPVLLAVPDQADAVLGLLTGLVEGTLTGPGDSRTSYVGFLAVGQQSPDRMAIATGVAAALSRKNRRVIVALDERDGGSVRRIHLQGSVPSIGPDRISADPQVPVLVLTGGTSGRERGAAAVLVVGDRLERAIDQAPAGSLAGVVTVVLPNAPTQEVRAALRALRETGTPHLAVVHWLQPTPTRESRFTGGPSRVASARADERPVRGRALPSSVGTSRSS